MTVGTFERSGLVGGDPYHGGGVGSPGPGTYDPAFPLPFCLTQRAVVVLSSSHRFSKVRALSFSQSLMFPLIVSPAKAPRFAGLNFAGTRT